MAADKSTLGAVYMASAALTFSVVSALIKHLSPEGTVWHVAFSRFILGGLGMYGLARLGGLKIWGNRRRMLVARGLVGLIAFLCQVQAIKVLPLSVAMVLFFTFPIFAAILAPLVNGEKTPPGDWPLIGGALFGVALIFWPEEPALGFDLNMIYALVGAFFAGLATSFIRGLTADNNVYTLYFYFCLVGGSATLWPVLFQSAPIIPGPIDLSILILASLLAMIAQLCINHGYTILTAARGGVILMAQVVLAGAYGVIFLGEPITWRLIVGAILILSSGIYLTVK